MLVLGFLPAFLVTCLMLGLYYPDSAFDLDPTGLHFGINWDERTPRAMVVIVVTLVVEYVIPLAIIVSCYSTIVFTQRRSAAASQTDSRKARSYLKCEIVKSDRKLIFDHSV